jgi:O-antigen ligase
METVWILAIRTVILKIQDSYIVFNLIINLIFFIPATRQIHNKKIYKTTLFFIV